MRRPITVLLALAVGLAPGAAMAASDPYRSLQWGLRRIDAPRAWSVSTGEGTIVAVVDTGVDASHPDLVGRVLPGLDLIDGGDGRTDPNGHGTLIAGVIAARSRNGEGVASVAPGARILPVRVLDASGTGSSADLAAGIRYATASGADVINLSLANEPVDALGRNLLRDPGVDRAIAAAARAGAAVIVAAGNDPSGGHTETAYRTRRPGVLVVGASTRDDRRAAYSNYGPGLDLVAPGGGSARDASDAACTERSGIVSTWWNPAIARSAYGAGCGTSLAVGFVSGVAALLTARGVTGAAATTRIERTADDLGPVGWDARTGAGRLNAAHALGASDASTIVLGARVERDTVAAQGSSHPIRGDDPAGPVGVAGLLLAAVGMAHGRRAGVQARRS